MRTRFTRAITLLGLSACSPVPQPQASVAPSAPPGIVIAPTTPTVARGNQDRPSVLEPGAYRDPNRSQPTHPARVSATGGSGTSAPGTSPLVTAPATPVAPVTISVSRVQAAEGEDGRGNTVRATHAVAIDLITPDGWPGGALGTTLFVGPLGFHNMGYPAVTTMRFIVADGRALPAGVEVALQYGSAPSRRRVLASSLPVPQ